MNLHDIANLRLINQQIAGSEFKTAKEIVGWMGAMQAQDFAMSKWAIGARLPGTTEKMIEAAIDNGEIIRTHLLRPTWHLVSADDIYWMLRLTAPHIKASMKSRDKQLELDEKTYSKCNIVLEKALQNSTNLTREALVACLNTAGISTSDNRASHIFMRAELEGIICSGISTGNKQTYALLSLRVADEIRINRDEALAKLANTYFKSHGPATLKDFNWWSGLPAADSRKAIEMVKPGFISETIEGETYWFTESVADALTNKESVYLLPAFDEFIISYKDRTSTLQLDHHSKAVSSNGIFRPVIVINGKVAGIWKRSLNKNKILLETGFFNSTTDINRKMIDVAVSDFGKFMNRAIDSTEIEVIALK
jgi:hypothetical protein